ncbi:MAG TPA: RES family NAD+ phosphorylase [Jatrophihabitans sp.]|uniref:RES family NAD+ phosphorylase n=1 Tax=Jatrophihabitans sp. TaxID=1932789 RepID=UPI002EF04053
MFPFDEDALPGEPGHPEYLHKPQGQGRLDNPASYDTWYFAATPEAAVGEVFGDLTTWGDDMFELPALPNALRVLGIFELPDSANLLDLDDPKALYERRLRPTQVIARRRAVTQSWALDIFKESEDTGARQWAGVQWWSFQRPHWTVYGLWYSRGEAPIHKLVDWDFLDVNHPAVADAARSLGKTFI